MKYFRIIQYAEGEHYETKETIIPESIFLQYRDLISQGKEKLVLEDRVISVSSIKEIIPADDIVAEYQKEGMRVDGLLEPVDQPKLPGKVESIGKIMKKKLEDFENGVKNSKWYKSIKK
jgi:hypothetical protein